MFDGKVVVRIRDNGIGMTEDVRAHAFDKFYQGERSHTGQGSGLGLALVRRIISLSSGTIELQSKEGKGTEITVSLKNEQQSVS
ncbi:Sensor protein kinase WalK [bioreactor metagenome]|uniref:Sensor protein kinase WalK n=1 Tax=bioreactor metagenome TaxID=1076179 RepID=A0A645IB99_9ZZZZ